MVSIFDPYIEHEIWNNNLFKFQSQYYVNNFAAKRIATIRSTFTGIIQSKTQYNAKCRRDDQVEILQSLTSLPPTNASEISNNARQAYDIYLAAKPLQIVSKPILLFYAFEKLADIAVALSYQVPGPPKNSHGLSYHTSRPIEIKKLGLYQRFHDCFSEDPSVYMNNCSFDLPNLLKADIEYDTSAILNQHPSLVKVKVKDMNSGNDIMITELDREFIILFSLATLARYRVNEWNDIIEAKVNDLGRYIQKWLRVFEVVFPNSIVFILHSNTFNSTYGKFT